MIWNDPEKSQPLWSSVFVGIPSFIPKTTRSFPNCRTPASKLGQGFLPREASTPDPNKWGERAELTRHGRGWENWRSQNRIDWRLGLENLIGAY